jgi:hypothetical protein
LIESQSPLWKNGLKEQRDNFTFVIFEVLTAAKMSMLVFWVVTPFGLVGRYQSFGENTASFSPEDRGSMFLRNVGICLQVHMASQPGRPTSTTLLKKKTPRL